MAQKRMFSKKIVQTDAFMDMGVGSQVLYFHLVMEADDDGFVSSPKKIMKMVGSSSDDYKVLLAKRFILPFESGVCVVKHWWIHNTLYKDRYHITVYQDELKTLQIKDNGAYTENDNKMLTDSSQMVTQTKLNETKLNKTNLKDTLVFGEHENVKLTEEEYSKLVDKLGETNTKILIEELSSYMASKGKRYSSHYATIQTWARRRVQEHNEKNNKRTIV